MSFREINRLRKDLRQAQLGLADARTQLAMLRGELVLARCQIKLFKERERKRKKDMKRRASLASQKSRRSEKVWS